MPKNPNPDIPAFLRTPTGVDDEKRRAAETDDAVDVGTVEPDPKLVTDLERIIPPEPAASQELTQQADVPYFQASSGLARDIATKLAEVEQRLAELANDIDLSRQSRDASIENASYFRDRAVELAQNQYQNTVQLADNNHLQEVAVLRGRETDLIKTAATLKTVLESLK